jgi:hypothetical protein
MDKHEIASKIIRMMEKQNFSDWYKNQFENYITGDMEHDSGKTDAECREQIKTDIIRMLNL